MVVFLNSFFSYLLLMLVIAAVAGVAVFIGITLRKKKDQQSAGAEQTDEQ